MLCYSHKLLILLVKQIQCIPAMYELNFVCFFRWTQAITDWWSYYYSTYMYSYKRDFHWQFVCSHLEICLFGFFAKLQKATTSFIMSVRPSVPLSAWNNSAPTERIFMIFGILSYFRKSVMKIQVSLKCDKNNWYFMWRPIHILHQISISTS